MVSLNTNIFLFLILSHKGTYSYKAVLYPYKIGSAK